jgi:hypothetical protein
MNNRDNRITFLSFESWLMLNENIKNTTIQSSTIGGCRDYINIILSPLTHGDRLIYKDGAFRNLQ